MRGAEVTHVRPSHAVQSIEHQLTWTLSLPTDAAFALGGEDGHLTVGLDNIRHLSIDGTKATFGGGNRLGDVALYLWENGKHLPMSVHA